MSDGCEIKDVTLTRAVRVDDGRPTYEPDDFFVTLTVGELAKKFGLGPRVVRKLIADGKLRGSKVGRQYFVTKAAVKRFLYEQRVEPDTGFDEAMRLLKSTNEER